MIYPIYTYGQPVLRKKAIDIESDYPEMAQIITNMFETLEFSEGVGLAAPQVGFAIRLFIVDTHAFGDDYPEAIDFRRVFINAEILEENGEPWYFNEGCLSVPGIREDVLRKPEIKIRYVDETFTEHTETFSGIRARVIQHEYDHLEGKLLVDRISLIRRQLLKKRLNELIQGKANVNYKIQPISNK
ncbi:MAG: peptide deformylase [Bacteroidetes bacterium HGW-Bacteroidetes-21]|nr:MAG: peptide deformylase [Bacteroidetes bacterium HGW-Bacteroidetes-21]